MTREEAKRFWLIRYENAKDYSDPHWEAQERREHREYVEALRMAIEALSTDAVQEWIPCSERLPEEYDEYLCQDADGDRFVGWLENAEWCKKHVVKWNIVAWMPLPERYKGGK